MSNATVKKARILTVDDLASLLEAAVNKIANPHVQARPTRPNIDDLRKRQDKAILRHELAQEKQERVKRAIEREAPLEEQLAALGGEDSISPLQLVKLKGKISTAQEQQALHSSNRSENHDLARRVLGQAPSTREMERLADIRLKLQGSNIGSNERSEIEINGYPIQGSNLVDALQYLVKGARGFKGHVPPGVKELGDLLSKQGVASSKFPESVRPYLGGKTGRSKRETLQTNRGMVRLSPKKSGVLRPGSLNATAAPIRARLNQEPLDDEISGLATTMSEQLSLHDSDNEEQTGSGIVFLNQAMDHAEQGNHDEAWDVLNEARQFGAPREKLKKAENYISSLRD